MKVVLVNILLVQHDQFQTATNPMVSCTLQPLITTVQQLTCALRPHLCHQRSDSLCREKIKPMKDNKSPGVDGIPPKLLMETVEQISIPLARVFNLSLKEGVVPFEWKEANIIPLFKKGSRNKSENYRPVSLTSVICKLLERLIKDHMVDFLVKHKLLNSSQHGFLKARSCLTNYVMLFGRNH